MASLYEKKDLWNDNDWIQDANALDEYVLEEGGDHYWLRLDMIFPPTDEDIENDKFPLDYLLELTPEERNKVIQKNVLWICKYDFDRVIEGNRKARRR